MGNLGITHEKLCDLQTSYNHTIRLDISTKLNCELGQLSQITLCWFTLLYINIPCSSMWWAKQACMLVEGNILPPSLGVKSKAYTHSLLFAWLTFRTWIWRQLCSSKLHGIITQMTVLFLQLSFSLKPNKKWFTLTTDICMAFTVKCQSMD